MCPGIPDIYQGAELWHQVLVDPDNRAEVDFGRRVRLLDAIAALEPQQTDTLLAGFADGRLKLYVLYTLLRCRARRRQLLTTGSYAPLAAGEHAVAFERALAGERLVCLVPRLSWTLLGGRNGWPVGDVWGDRAVAVPPGRYVDAFTGAAIQSRGHVRIADCLRRFPVAVLTPVSEDDGPVIPRS
jgi:(1->4)-alpha-D-glucan 1-alpha-D-glucosylmutase